MVQVPFVRASLLVMAGSLAHACHAESTGARDGSRVANDGPAVVAAGQGETAQPVRDWRWIELELALAAAEMLPARGVHLRERSRMQEIVGLAYLGIGDPGEAIAIARRTDGWRRGTLIAAAALEAARSGRAAEARGLAREALAAIDSYRDWERDAVRVRVAQVHAWLGDTEESARLERGVGEPDQGKVALAVAGAKSGETLGDAEFDAQVRPLGEWIATKNFDLVRNASDVALELYPPAFADPARRARIESLLADANSQLAYDLRIANLARMAAIAASKGAPDAARAFIAQAEVVRDGAPWILEDDLVQWAVIAKAKAEIGDRDAALEDLARALARFDERREEIADIFRGRPLRALAEACVRAGDAERARAVYALALAEGARNPNARPRAVDLVETIASMVATGIAPDESMRASMRATREGLVDPW